MKRIVVTSALGAFIAALASLRLSMPTDAQQRYYRAHNAVEQLAFRREGTEELRKAVTEERMAEKELFVLRDLGGKMIWASAACSAATLVLAVVALKRRPGDE